MFSLKSLWSDRKDDTPAVRIGDLPASRIPRALTPFPRSDVKDEPLNEVAKPLDTRGADRFVPARTATILVTDNGKKLKARIINVSSLGIAVEADFSQVPSQSIVMVGERKVTPGRKIARGTVYLFEKPLPPSQCGPHFVV